QPERKQEIVLAGKRESADHGDEKLKDQRVQRKKGAHRRRYRKLEPKTGQQRDWPEGHQNGLKKGLRQRVDRQDPLAKRRQVPPGSLSQHLQEALVPSGALSDQRTDALRRLFAGHPPRVVDDPDRLAQGAQSQPDVRVLGQAVLIPPTDSLHQVRADENRVPAQWDHSLLGVVKKSALEPEEVLQHVVDAEPVVEEVHQLDSPLDDPHVLFGVEDCDDTTGRALKSDVQAVRLADRTVGKGLDPRVARAKLANRPMSLLDRVDVVLVTDDDD